MGPALNSFIMKGTMITIIIAIMIRGLEMNESATKLNLVLKQRTSRRKHKHEYVLKFLKIINN